MYPTFQGFGLRVQYATFQLRAVGRGELTASELGNNRKMDNCFEMYDGKAVIFALMKTAKSDPVLMKGISTYQGNQIAIDHWHSIYEEGLRQQRRQLSLVFA